jgi:inosine-uridine nucleoside N-ribohydrolase
MPEGERLTIICTGAVTNVASAIQMEPAIVDKVVVYSIGTRYHFEKNAWDKNEFNVRNDLNAYDVLLNTKGLELHVMPANVARPVIFTREETLPRLRDEEGIEELILKRWHEVVRERDQWIMWDIALVQAIIHPEWAKQKVVQAPPENANRQVYLYTQVDEETMIHDFWKVLVEEPK